MERIEPSHLRRLSVLLLGCLRPPPGRSRIAIALVYGVLCHALFAIAVVSMIVSMYFGMTKGMGPVPAPWNWIVNALLILQFPLGHSIFLTKRGRGLLSRLAPQPYGATLSTTSYAGLASCQLIALFILWSPSGIIWWQAEGTLFGMICGLYALSWLLLLKASFDAGAEVQSGALGWMSLLQRVRPSFPPMPTNGLFRLIRQPIYLSFALTLWTVPVWTPDQLMLALGLTLYCLVGPRLKEVRFATMFGPEFQSYRRKTPYMIPRFASLGIAVSHRRRKAGGKDGPAGI